MRPISAFGLLVASLLDHCIIKGMERFTGERRGLAATVLAFYGFIYFLMAMSGMMPEWTAAWGSMAALYGMAFFALVAGYFWARWYAIGLGLSGLATAAFGVFQIGFDETLLFYGGTHGAVALLLYGRSMSATFDGRKDWRSRFHMSEAGSNKLGKAVVQATISLPYILLYALAPKDGMGAAGFVALALAGGGVYGLIKMRTWGVVAMAGAGLAVFSGLVLEPSMFTSNGEVLSVQTVGIFGGALALAAIAPFAGPLVRYLRSDL